MSIAFVFWFLMLLDLIFGFWAYPPFVQTNYRPFGGHLFFWVVVALLGWHDFGFPIHG